MSNRINPNPVQFQIITKNCIGLEKPPESGTPTAGGFLEATGRIADIEALNGATKGLDILNKTAAAGGPNLTRIINGGANTVIDTVLSPTGIGSEQVFGTINRVQPSAVNSMVGSATDIHKKLSDGNFSASDIPNYTRAFANVIKIGGRLLTPKDSKVGIEVCHAKPYAMDMLEFGVKLNYRFLVQFEFNSPYDQSMGALDFKFLLKSSDRPTVQFEYEDVNMYNFHTKVIKRTTYNPITMSFYDDQQSQTLDLYKMYLNTMSPISNISTTGGADLFEETQFNFNDRRWTWSGRYDTAKNETFGYPSSIAPLANGNREIIRTIRLFHLYYGGAKMDVYTLHRPRIMEMELDGLDMTSETAGNGLKLQLSYDGMFLETFHSTQDIQDIINKGVNHDMFYQTEDRLVEPNIFNPDLNVETPTVPEETTPPPDNRNFLQKASDFVTGKVAIF